MTTSRLREYWIDLSFQIEAHDLEEAREIARDLLQRAKENSPFRTIGGEIRQIEEA